MYPALISAFYSTAWAILPEKLEAIRAFLKTKAAGGAIDEERVEALAAARRADGVQMVGRVAVLPVFGIISQRVGMLARASGGISTEEIGVTLDGLVRDPAVKAIVMAYDTPGGSVPGVMELAAKIRAAAAQKKIVGFVDPMAASAGYWLISQASEIYCTPSGEVGSIGVFMVHDDDAEALKLEGVTRTLVASTPYKAELWQPLTEDAKAYLQRDVDAIHAQFVADVAKGRGVNAAKVDKSFGQGRMLNANDALAAGMVDGIATFDQVLRKLGEKDAGAQAAAADPRFAQAAAARARLAEIGG